MAACDTLTGKPGAKMEIRVKSQNMIEAGSMVTRTRFLGMPAVLLILVLFFAGPAASEDARGAPARDQSTRFDDSNSHSFPQIFIPTPFPSSPPRDWTTRNGFKTSLFTAN